MTMLPSHTWQVRVRRSDGSEFNYTTQMLREPQRGEIVETGDIGRNLRARITSFTKEAPREGAAGLGVWQIEATEL
jgi:hypothetical protein